MIWSSDARRRTLWIRKEVTRWLQAGIISPPQAEQILAQYPDPTSEGEFRVREAYLAGLVALGAGLLTVAAGTWLAARWDAFSHAERLGLVFAGWVLAHIALVRWSKWLRGWVAREVATLLLAVLFPILLGQVMIFFNINVSSRTVLFLWICGLIPQLLMFLPECVGILYSTLLLWWAVGVPFDLPNLAEAQSAATIARFYAFLPLWMIGMLTYGRRLGPASFALATSLAVWLVSCVRYWPPIGTAVEAAMSGAQHAAHFGFIGVGLYVLGYAFPREWRTRVFFEVLGIIMWVGSAVSLGSLRRYTPSSTLPVASEGPDILVVTGWWLVLAMGLLALLAGAIAVMTWGAHWRGGGFRADAVRQQTKTKLQGPGIPIVSIAGFLGIFVLEGLFRGGDAWSSGLWPVVQLLVGATLGLVAAIYFLWRGWQSGQRPYFEAGVLTLLVWTAARIYDQFGLSLTDAALLFTAAGGVLWLVYYRMRHGLCTRALPSGAEENLHPTAGLMGEGATAPRGGGVPRVNAGSGVVVNGLWQLGVVAAFCGWYFGVVFSGYELIEIPVVPPPRGERVQWFLGRSLWLKYPINQVDCRVVADQQVRLNAEAIWGKPTHEPAFFNAQRELYGLVGKEIFVRVSRPASGHQVGVESAQLSRPTEGLFVRGRIAGVRFDYKDLEKELWVVHACYLEVEYGIEEVYIREHELGAWRAAIAAGRVAARVAVSSSGYVRLVEIIRKDRPLF